MKRALLMGIIFCGGVFGQSAAKNEPTELPRFSMHEYQLKFPPARMSAGFSARSRDRTVALAITRPTACAVPLLNALRAQDKTAYQIQVLKPSATEAMSEKAPVGLPTCPPAVAK